MVLPLEFLGIRSILACVGEADSAEWYTRWYSRILRTVSHIDVKDDQFILFHRARRNIYRLAKSHSASAVRGDSDCASRCTWPASSVFHDRLKRAVPISKTFKPKHATAGTRPTTSSPRVKLSLSQSSTPSSRVSPKESCFSLRIKVSSSTRSPRLMREMATILVRISPHRPMTVASPLCRTHNSPQWSRGNKLLTLSSDKLCGSLRRSFRARLPSYEVFTMRNSIRNESKRSRLRLGCSGVSHRRPPVVLSRT